MRRRSRPFTQVMLLGLVVVGIALGSSIRRPIAQKSAGPEKVRLVSRSEPLVGDPGQKGATYYALEARTTRLITSFRDGTKAVAQRSFDGGIATALQDAAGNELNRFRVRRADGPNDALLYLPSAGDPIVARPQPGLRTTLDWLNLQSHHMFGDKVQADTSLDWVGGMMRRAGSAVMVDRDAETAAIEAVWMDELSARTTVLHPKAGDRYDGQPVKGAVFVTRLMLRGVQIGVANYFTRERIYAWDIPGIDAGSVGDEHLKARYGGWPFAPDMMWMNLQLLAKYHWRTAIQQQGFVARNGACGSRKAGLAERLTSFLVPPLSANEAGCDPPLQWLDGTMFRYCCDIHDYCYEKYGCTASTWWRWFSSWQCDFCNMGAIFCFVGTGKHGVLYPAP